MNSIRKEGFLMVMKKLAVGFLLVNLFFAFGVAEVRFISQQAAAMRRVKEEHFVNPNPAVLSVRDIDPKGKIVLLRVDYNVVSKGRIKNDMRIRETLEDIKYLVEKGAKKIVLVSHNGDVGAFPQDGKGHPDFSLAPVYPVLQKLLLEKGIIKDAGEFAWVDDSIGDKVKTALANTGTKLALLENTRFYEGETSKDSAKVDEYARLLAESSGAEIYVNAAFAAAHRGKQASLGPIAKFIKVARVAGLLMDKELKVLGGFLEKPVGPVTAIMGGAKVSDKVNMMKSLISNNRADKIIVVGAMAFPFMKAKGIEVGDSMLGEKSEQEEDVLAAEYILKLAALKGKEIVLPVDFTVVNSQTGEVVLSNSPTIQAGQKALDIGNKTIQLIKERLGETKTIILNGTAGVYTDERFFEGTRGIAELVAAHSAQVKIILGGDGVAGVIKALGEERARQVMTLLSTGGGAALMYIGGEKLNALDWLDQPR
jgi:3-phosphoglycerate kinase